MRLLISVISLFGAGPLLAQQADQTIPRELAVAFARGYAIPDSNVAIDFVPGAIAPAVADKVSAPPGARLIGTVTVARNTYMLAASIDSPDSILAWYGRDYTKRGWSAYSLVRALQNQSGRGGFRSPPPTVPSSFCSEGTVADVSATRGPDGQTNIRVRLGPPPVVAVCPQPGTDVRRPTPSAGVAPPPLPILYDPPAGSSMNQCYAAGSSQQSQTQVQTTLDPPALAQHYGKQLETQGWSPLVGEYPIARSVFSRRDSAGAMEIATLSVAVNPAAPMCRSATIDVLTLRRP